MPLSPRQRPALPRAARPIVVFGAGGIVRDAHLPAYRLAGFPVAGLYDPYPGKARALAAAFGIPRVYASVAEAVAAAPRRAVFDVAVPAPALAGLLPALPRGAAVLIQKPFGEDLAQARALRALCRRRRFRAGVNFQLRYAPCVLAARDLIARGVIGELHDVEARVTVYMPWQLWTFLEKVPRVEILYHSIHYVDLIRSFLGEPRGVYAKTLRSPKSRRLASTRSNIVLDYGDLVRANITTNHSHEFGPRHQESYIKWEGTRGAIKAHLGLLLNYPRGEPDALEYCTLRAGGRPGRWRRVPLAGNWYPHAFIGTMAGVMRFANGETRDPPISVDDAVRTMAVVEAAYRSSAAGATPIPAT
ncbi:MAG TPA: Gfo/Idh/MocA family oxidoreductase [Candidatus Sulfotelmatobacter sp.]|nr:Gfo/Idh/MocA family oxidoreductase [Candidatus Sulfotelmatobacter sp.]